MDFVITLVFTAVLSVALRKPIKKLPLLFYGLAVALVALLFAGTSGLVPGSWWKFTVPLVQQCMLSFALFTVVMFIGCLPDGRKVTQRLRGIRSELSVAAFILCFGHMVPYIAPYATRVASGTADGATATSFALALVVGVLLVVLGVTSFAFVKRSMSTAKWKRLQRLAYMFFGLVYVHLVLMMAPSAAHGAAGAVLSIAAYTVVFGAYAVLRVTKALHDQRETSASRAVQMSAFDEEAGFLAA